MVKKVVMPSAGQTTDVATVTKLHVAVGDAVRKGDVLMEVETDKAVLPIESFAKGFVTEICVNEFDKVDAGTLLLTIGDAADLEAAKSCAKTEEASAPAGDAEDDFVAVMEATPAEPEASVPVTLPMPKGKPAAAALPAMPNAKKLAAEKGIDLDTVAASNGSFIKAADVRAAAESTAKAACTAAPAADTVPTGRMRDSLARRWDASAAVPTFSASVSVSADAAAGLCLAASDESTKATAAHLVMLALARLSERYQLLRVTYANGTQRISDDAGAALAVFGDNGTVSAAVTGAAGLGLRAVAAACAANAAAVMGGDMSSVDRAAFTVFDATDSGVDSFLPPLRTPETAAFGVSDCDGRMNVSAVFDVRVWEGRTALSLMKDLKARLDNPALMLI